MNATTTLEKKSTASRDAAAAPSTINGVDPAAIGQLLRSVADDATAGQTHWRVRTFWEGGNRTRTQVKDYQIGGRTIEKDWTIRTDEPLEIGGTNTQPNPQEYLLAAVNACMMVTYVDYAAVQGITIENIEIETDGDIDLRGLFQLGDNVNPGYDELRYTVRIKADATEEQLQALHETVKKTSPNFANMARAVAMKSRLQVE